MNNFSDKLRGLSKDSYKVGQGFHTLKSLLEDEAAFGKTSASVLKSKVAELLSLESRPEALEKVLELIQAEGVDVTVVCEDRPCSSVTIKFDWSE